MAANEPWRHHYAPQFYLKNFAFDAEKKKVMVVRKHGNRAVWAKSSIRSLGFESEFYVHFESGVPVSVETSINKHVESPISASATWKKIGENRASDLDQSDRAVLYSLVRNFAVRTPHHVQISKELAFLAGQPTSEMQFSRTEKAMYAAMRADPTLIKKVANTAASTIAWTAEEFRSCGMSVFRTQGPVYVCTTPVHTMTVPRHPALRSVQLGLLPVSYLMPLTPHSYICLSLGYFDGSFSNVEVERDVEEGLKRAIVSQFSYFPTVQHMICSAEGLNEQLDWAGYQLIQESPFKKRYDRRGGTPAHKSPR